MLSLQRAKWFVCGHNGLIGSAFVRRLQSIGAREVLVRNRRYLDLTDQAAVLRFFEDQRPDFVVLAAGRVGGIAENQLNPANFIAENLSIQLNVLQAAQRAGAHKLIFFGSSCMYPRLCRQPMNEELLFTGTPEPTSLPYAVAKLAGLQTCLAYNQQYEQSLFIPVIPNSAYGPNDNFDPMTGHVLAALIHRFHEAKHSNAKEITLWGSGAPRREFIHADDIVDACLHIMSLDSGSLNLPINIGAGVDYSIRELAGLIAEAVGYQGDISWDLERPDGASQKLLDCARLTATGWRASKDLNDGIRETYEWYQARMDCGKANIRSSYDSQ